MSEVSGSQRETEDAGVEREIVNDAPDQAEVRRVVGSPIRGPKFGWVLGLILVALMRKIPY